MFLPNYKIENVSIELKHVMILILFFGYIISFSAFLGFLCDKYPQIEHFVDTHPFLIILTRIVFLIVIPAFMAMLIIDFKDRKKSRCPKCKTKYKYANMEIGPGKIISTFQCKKCGYENKITEPFVFKKFERMFGNAVDSGNFTAEQIMELKEMSEQYEENLNNQE